MRDIRHKSWATFLQVPGFPEKSAESKRHVNVEVQFVLGIQPTSSIVRTDYCKIPLGAPSLAQSDSLFSKRVQDAMRTANANAQYCLQKYVWMPLPCWL